MELLELVTNLREVLDVDTLDDLPDKLMELSLSGNDAAIDDIVKAVGGDLTVDFLQAVYQYYAADRKGLKQDFTPKSIGRLISAMIGDADTVVDMCAGSGALTIQRHNSKGGEFACYEYDEKVIPYLLFNLLVRNIPATVYQGDVLTGEEQPRYRVEGGEKYGRVVDLQSAV